MTWFLSMSSSTDWVDLVLFGHAEMHGPDMMETSSWVDENILFSSVNGTVYCFELYR